ncbi:MAG TPA: DUF481 domain-containing protein, partial [Bacteroidales bacterium]|nr:DUF481 domain-containing protein [Bacteroidales bacterium]
NEFEVGEQLRLDWNYPIQDYYGVIEYDFKRANKQKTKNKGFIHLRTIRQLNMDKIMAEAFTQLEFDQFLQLRSRFLLGMGIRSDLVQLFSDSSLNKPLKLFIGVGVMHEGEHYTTDPHVVVSHSRSTNYISLAMSLSDQAQLGFVTYYQPALEDFNDFRFSADLNLTVDVIKNLALILKMRYLHRSIAIGESVNDDQEIKTGLIFKLP